MESMSSNLKASLPFNIEDDVELTDRFKDSALSITALFKHAQKSRRAGYTQGYSTCVSDLRDFIRSNAEPERPLTVGAILDYLESRQVTLLRDLEAPSSSPSKPIQSHPAKSLSPPSLPRKSISLPPQNITNIKRASSKTAIVPLSPPRIAPWGSPSLSPAPLPEPAWPSETPKAITTSWPEVSVLSMIPITADLSATLPNAGAKRKRDALAEVERSNAILDPRRHGGSRKRKVNVNKGGSKLHSPTEDWSMNLEDEDRERDRKRVRG